MNCKTGKKSFAWLMAFAMILNLLFLPSVGIKAAASGVTVEITQSGSWGSGSSEYTMFNCVITNNTSVSISNWTVTMPFASTVTLDQGWCGTFSMSNGILTITPSGNDTIAAGSNTSLGFIVINAGTYQTSDAAITYDGASTSTTASAVPSTSASVKPSTQASTAPTQSAAASVAPSTTPSTGSASATGSTGLTSVGDVDLSTISTVSYKKKDLDATWDSSSADTISFSSSSATVSGSAASANGGVVTISAAGTFVVSGTCSDGQLIVNAGDDDFVHIILNDANITSKTSAPIYVMNADKVVVTLAAGTTNTLSDTSSFSYTDTTNEEPNATVFSKDDLTFNGAGSLTVNSNFNNAVQSKDKLKFVDGTYIIKSVSDAIKGKDCVGICGGTFNITASGDGIQATNDNDLTVGYVEVSGGNVTVDASKDGIQAESFVNVYGGTIDITANSGYTNGKQHSDGGGFPGSSSSTTTTTDSTGKGLKAATGVLIYGGDITINSADDALHTNDVILIDGGTITAQSGDDGIHADTTLYIASGDITVKNSYEGYEGAYITIAGGYSYVTASDDGVNAGNSGTATGGGMDAVEDALITISGGTIIVNASGDGLDSNGNAVMTGGTALVSGPTNGGNGALDYNGTFNISGGILVAAGATGMVQATSTSSSQACINYTFSATQSANSLVCLRDAGGNDIIAFNPAKTYQNVIISAPALSIGSTYSLYGGTPSTSTMKQLSTSEYSLGSLVSSISLTSTVTSGGSSSSSGSQGGMTPPSGGPSGRPGRG